MTLTRLDLFLMLSITGAGLAGAEGRASAQGCTRLPTGVCEDTCAHGFQCDSRCIGCEEILAGTICGTKYRDNDLNGTHGTGEPGLSGFQIIAVDAGGGSQTATTDAAGNYCITVSPGTYTLSELAQIGWAMTSPLAGSYTVTVGPGQTITGLDFGNQCCHEVPPSLNKRLNTGLSDTTSTLIAPGSNDDSWQVRPAVCNSNLIDTGTGTFGPVQVVNPDPFAWATQPLSRWISAVAAGGNAQSPGSPPTCYEYRTCFCMARPFSGAFLSLDFYDDDQIDSVALNGSTIFTGPVGGFSGTPQHVQYQDVAGLHPKFRCGNNCVSVFVRDTFGVVTGLDVAASITAQHGFCCGGPACEP